MSTSLTAPPSDRHPPTVLVTGAAKHLGREIALALAASGWKVAIHYRDSVEDARKTVATCASLTPGAASFRTNLSNETAVRNLIPTVVEEFGYLDAVVNSASTFENDTASNFSFAAMDKHLRSNVGAAALLSQALHNHMGLRSRATQPGQPQPQGVVVNLLDRQLDQPDADHFSYTLSKAALETATATLARTLSPGVQVVGVEVPRGAAPLDRAASAKEVSVAVLSALQGALPND
jgi:NAD(P)-dependent dehydrogenase (short-subunit alcohol dehydrogenase family)